MPVRKVLLMPVGGWRSYSFGGVRTAPCLVAFYLLLSPKPTWCGPCHIARSRLVGGEHISSLSTWTISIPWSSKGTHKKNTARICNHQFQDQRHFGKNYTNNSHIHLGFAISVSWKTMARLVLLSLLLSVSLGASVKPEQLDVDDATWMSRKSGHP